MELRKNRIENISQKPLKNDFNNILTDCEKIIKQKLDKRRKLYFNAEYVIKDCDHEILNTDFNDINHNELINCPICD